MSVNLLDLLKYDVVSKFVGPAAGFLGASESSTEQAMSGILPSVLGVMINKASNQSGAEELMGMFANADGGLLNNIGDLFGPKKDSLDGLMTGGGEILGALLGGGNKMGGLIDIVAKMSDLNSGIAGSLLKLATPFIMSAIGMKVKSMAIDALGLSKLLAEQKSYVADALPSGFGNILGIGDMLSDAKESVGNVAKATLSATTSTASSVVNTGKAAGRNLIKWLLPALLALVAIGYIGTRGCNTGIDAVDNSEELVAETTLDAVDMANKAVGVTSDALKGAFGTVDAAAKAALANVKFMTGSIGDQMSEFISGGFAGDNTFTFKNLTFNSGSVTLTGESQREIDELAAILKAFPGVRFVIEGHTDSTGDEASNQVLSLDRANSVKSALEAAGIDHLRMSTAGFGSSTPRASNDTEENRAQNRRIELHIVK